MQYVECSVSIVFIYLFVGMGCLCDVIGKGRERGEMWGESLILAGEREERKGNEDWDKGKRELS